jgi:hypothetical protein
MKKYFSILVVLLWASFVAAQTNQEVRLAIVPETPDAGAAVDLLMAEISQSDQVHLLERVEIERVYREQGLSALNRDSLKLGQILGADGLLLLESAEETNQMAKVPIFMPKRYTVKARLVAVKPGVVLADEKFSVLDKDLPEWGSSFAKHLNSFLPKLAVQGGDEIPISVVNLRSAISSTDASETEQQLKSLTIQRLSREPQLFVLERQRMQLLSEEKALQADESAFWSGGYLFDAVLDKNGFSPDTMTIDARLTPSKGGQPLLFEVHGSRTNLAQVVNLLAVKVTELLKVNSVSKEWNAADEAAQYFKEAQWALRWGVYPEAQMAAESAWALGKKDLDCAVLRNKAYLQALSVAIGTWRNGEGSILSGIDANGKQLATPPSDARMNRLVRETMAEHKFTTITKITTRPGSGTVDYAFQEKFPENESIDQAIHVLELYDQFSRTSPDGEPKILCRGKGWNDWHDSEWYKMGIEDLVAASKVLQCFNVATNLQAPVADKLAELRARARSTAGMISSAPSVHDSYFVGDRVVTRDELSHTMEEQGNIFLCELDWGEYWQEKPEDGLVLYRELLASPVFCYIHSDFWSPKPPASHLVAWNADDEKRLPALWKSFVAELEDSSNVLLRMESKALLRADAPNEEAARAAEADWWSLVRSNREELVGNNVELFYLGWHFAYNPETEEMDQEFLQKTVPAKQMVSAFEKQKLYLSSFTPYNWDDFNKTFGSRDFTQAQAAELLPLIFAYKSNLLAQLPANASPLEKFKAKDNAQWIEFYLEGHIKDALKPPKPAPVPLVSRPPQQPPQAIPQPVLPDRNTTSFSVSNGTPEEVTNVLVVKKFLPIPLDGLFGTNISGVKITAHHWSEGKLLLNFQYGAFVGVFDEKGNWTSTRSVDFPAIAILDPATEQWQVITCPEADFASRNHFYHRTTLYRGDLFTSEGGQIRKYDAVKKAWQALEIPQAGNCELFTVDDRLFAATQNLIVEILDGGPRTQILASNRRQPPASALDTEDLGTPVLFAGPRQSLRAAAGDKIVTWDGKDWRTICPAPQQAPLPPVISGDDVLFFENGWNSAAGIWRLPAAGDEVEFCFGQISPRGSGMTESGSGPTSKPEWKLPPRMSLPRMAAASRGADMFLLADHAIPQKIVDEQRHVVIGTKVLPQNGYHAELLCFASNCPAPQTLFLKFEGENARLPVTGDSRPAGFMAPSTPPGWLLFSPKSLFLGQETPDAIPRGGGDPRNLEPRAGVWMVSQEQMDAEIARQRTAQLAEAAQTATSAEQATKNLLAKYDLNHNGVIDPDERENALDDPAYIKASLDEIDTNHNGWLDPSELAWFDANQNKNFDSKEQAGVELAQKFLAEKLLNQFDPAGNGWLSAREYNQMIESTLQLNPNIEFDLQFPHVDSNHDNHLDLAELENLMQQHLETELQSRVTRGPIMHYMGMGAGPSAESRQRFKTAVEAYWQNPDGRINRPPMGGRVPHGAGNP